MMSRLMSPRWLITTLIVLAGVALCIRLGIWQLDRLEQRRAFNARVLAQSQAAALDLNATGDPQELLDEEYRAAFATGSFLPEQSVLLRNQVREGQLGYRLLVPLMLEGSDKGVLVDLGWIPADQSGMEDRQAFISRQVVRVDGMLRSSQSKTSLWGVADPPLEPGQQRLDEWNFVTVQRIAQQAGITLMPVFLQAAPQGKPAGPPYASLPQIELSEGSHMGYALQWFAFAAILGLGYPFFIRRQLRADAINGLGGQIKGD